jgi:aminoglycoside phosphotransferase (APT) family kinase protein
LSRRFGVTRLPGLPSRDETIAIYEAACGRTVRNMGYYEIVAALRMALVALGPFDRRVLRLEPSANPCKIEKRTEQG